MFQKEVPQELPFYLIIPSRHLEIFICEFFSKIQYSSINFIAKCQFQDCALKCKSLRIQEVNKFLFLFTVTYTKCRVDTDCLRVSNNSFCFDNDDNKVGRCKCLDGYELLTRNKTSFSCLKRKYNIINSKC